MKQKIYIVVVTVLLLCGTITIAFMKKSHSLPSEQTNVTDENGEILHSGESYPLPKKLLFSNLSSVEQLASEKITVEAILDPRPTQPIQLEWSVSFQDSSTQWAMEHDPSEFIVIQSESYTCTIQCIAPFAETMVLSCHSIYQPDIVATCALEYVQRITNRILDFESYELTYQEGQDLYYVDFGNDIVYSFVPNNSTNTTYSLGSVVSKRTTKFYYNLSEELEEYLLTNTDIFYKTTNAVKTEIEEWNIDQDNLFYQLGANPENIDYFNQLIYEAVPNFLAANPDKPLFIIELEFSTNYFVEHFTYRIGAKSWQYYPTIERISLDSNRIIL